MSANSQKQTSGRLWIAMGSPNQTYDGVQVPKSKPTRPEFKQFRHVNRGPIGQRCVLFLRFLFKDLTQYQ